MTNKEIEKIVKTYFKDLIFKDFVLYNDILIKLSSENIIYGFCFEKSSDKNSLFVWSFCLPAFIPNDCLNLSFGQRLSSSWLIKDNQNIENDMKSLLSIMTTEIVTFFEKVNSCNEFYNYYIKDIDSLRFHEALVYTAVYSKNPNLNSFLDDIIRRIQEKSNLSVEWINNLLLDMKYLKSIVDNEIEVEKLFQKNILNTKKILKIN